MAALVVSAFVSVVPSANAETLVDLEDIEAGDLIRGESYSAVYYYGLDGFTTCSQRQDLLHLV